MQRRCPAPQAPSAAHWRERAVRAKPVAALRVGASCTKTVSTVEPSQQTMARGWELGVVEYTVRPLVAVGNSSCVAF